MSVVNTIDTTISSDKKFSELPLDKRIPLNKNIGCNSWNEIKTYCEFGNFMYNHFLCVDIRVLLTNIDNYITFKLEYITCKNSYIIKDLPINIDNLIICIPYNMSFLEKQFTNLPSNLKILKFIFINESTMIDKRKYESNDDFNVLFDIKVPQNCDFTINYQDDDYTVSQLGPSELELKSKSNKKSYIIKYCEKNYNYEQVLPPKSSPMATIIGNDVYTNCKNVVFPKCYNVFFTGEEYIDEDTNDIKIIRRNKKRMDIFSDIQSNFFSKIKKI